MSAKVSVIVPVYNVEMYLERCLDSLVNQQLLDIEIIIVIDGSPDNSLQIANEYSKHYSNIIVINQQNCGLACARNSGLQYASGEYIAFVDSDDFVDLNTFNIAYGIAIKNNYEVLYYGYNNVSINNSYTSISEVDDEVNFNDRSEINQFLLDMIALETNERKERKYRMSVWHAIYKRNVIADNNIRFYSEREFISEDILFHIEFLNYVNSVGIIPNPLYYYCYNATSLTKTFRSDRFEKQIKLYKKINELLNKFNFENYKYDLRSKKFFIGYVRDTVSSIFKSDLSIVSKYQELGNIVNNKIWDQFLDYPINLMPFHQRIMMYSIKLRMEKLLFLYACIYSKMRK
jgi:glycosyltransferase involved in cell wall biosynthesis